tara:strand:+ start:85 stop:960 length:876 start_codon:yes stop_codon:yes gene_type:complete
LYAESIKIITKVDNEIITNIDIENEKQYLLFLNPKLEKLNEKRIKDIAKNSLITEIIKRNELKKFYSFDNKDDLLEKIEKRLLTNKKINNKSELIKILENKNLDYKNIKMKFLIEALWNRLIYNKYSNNLRVDENSLRKKLINQFKIKNKKYEYNLSEILFTEKINESIDQTLYKLNKSISEIGFENTANIFSISSTSKNGGLIGWVNELQISEKIETNIKNLKKNEISVPMKIGAGYLLIKLNSKREFNQKINIDSQLRELVNKETNRQLNTFSVIFFKRIRMNTEINEL